MKDERPNGIVHNAIPPLTRGAQLIDQLVEYTVGVCNHPRSLAIAKRLAKTRISLERYMTKVEERAGMYERIKGNPNIGTHEATRRVYGRYRRDSFTVFEALDGWCFTIDGSTEHIGPHPTRATARTAGKKLMAELKKNAA